MRTHAWGREPVTTAIVRAVAAEAACDPTDLDPLYESVDPDAIEELFTDDRLLDARLEFVYAGHRVTVTSEGTITVVEEPGHVVQVEACAADSSSGSPAGSDPGEANAVSDYRRGQ